MTVQNDTVVNPSCSNIKKDFSNQYTGRECGYSANVVNVKKLILRWVFLTPSCQNNKRMRNVG